MTFMWQNQLLSLLEVSKLQLENSMQQLLTARVYADVEGQKECSYEFDEVLQYMKNAKQVIEIIITHYKQKKE